MEATQLVAHIDSPALHRSILGEFSGPYSLGVGQNGAGSKSVLVLQVPHGVGRSFPSRIDVAGELVDVIVHRDFEVPKALGGKRLLDGS